jgi:hypothetical protein
MARRESPIAVRNPLFTVLLALVAAVCFGSLLVMALLAALAHEPPTEMQRSLMEACRWGFSSTLGALIGLLCGRAAGPDHLGRLPEDQEAGVSRTRG